jgi:hydroxyacylglutathione hydrolase
MNDQFKMIDFKRVNVFLFRKKDGFLLIDTGMDQHWKQLESELISAGCSPGQLKLVVITHGDFDHTGNCAKLQEKYRAKIAMHQADSLMVEEGVMPKREIRSLIWKIFMLIIKWRMRKLTFDKFKPDLFLQDGQTLEEYGFDGRIIHLPGHTKGSIAVLTRDGSLFIGDIFVNTRKPDLSPFVDDFRELKKSVDKLRGLNIKMVYPSHGKPFPGEGISKISV